MRPCAPSFVEQRPEAEEPAGPEATRIAALEQALRDETAERRRAECMAHIQDQAAQLALDLIVTEPEIAGFFAELTRQLVQETEGHACGVWLLDDDRTHCELWLAHLHDSLYTPKQAGWDELAIPRVPMSEHLFGYAPGWTQTTVYTSHDARLPEAVQRFNGREQVAAVSAVPLMLGTHPLGWIVLSTGDASA